MRKKRKLRCAIGDWVECKTGRKNNWSKGEAVAPVYRDELMTPSVVAPYQVELEDGDLICAPGDDDLVRERT